MTLSGAWGDAVARAMESAPDIATRLALALAPVRSLIRIVDDHEPPLSVGWSERGMSGTNLRDGWIEINPTPVTAVHPGQLSKLAPAKALDVVSGLALHEAGHAKHSREAFGVLVKKDVGGIIIAGRPEEPMFEPVRVAAWLLNLLRDVFDEAAVAAEWPGFGPYFQTVLDWVWETEYEQAQEAPKWSLGTVPGLLSIAYHACRFADRYDPATIWPPPFREEFNWWSAWNIAFCTGKMDAREAIAVAMARLAIQAPDGMSQMTEEERAERRRFERLNLQIKRLMAEGVPGAPDPCPIHGLDGAINPDLARRVRELIDSGLTVVVPMIVTDDGNEPPTILLSKPPMPMGDLRPEPEVPPARTIEALRRALVFKPEDAGAIEKLRRSGEFDDTEIHRWAEGDYRLFCDRPIEQAADALMWLLIDLSGSMCHTARGTDKMKLSIAEALARAFVEASGAIEGVEAAVWGHSTSLYTPTMTGSANVYRLWEPGDPYERIALAQMVTHAENYDGYAIATAVEAMRHREQASKVLFVLSDGWPAGRGYGGASAARHIRSVVDWATSQGVTVIQIAIDHDLRPADQAEMFGDQWVSYASWEQLPKDLGRLMARFAV